MLSNMQLKSMIFQKLTLTPGFHTQIVVVTVHVLLAFDFRN